VKDRGEKIFVQNNYDEKAEAEFVTKKMLEYHFNFKIPWQNMAILYRTNFQSRPFEEALRLHDIPYNIVGGMQFYDRKEIKDILAYLKIIANEKDEISLLRVINYPRRGVGDKSVYNLNQYSMKEQVPLYEAAQNVFDVDGIKPGTKSSIIGFVELIEKYKTQFFHTKKPMYKVAKDLIDEIKYEDELMNNSPEPHLVKRKMFNISELINSIKGFEDEAKQMEEPPSLYNYLSKISLMSDDEKDEEDKQQGEVSLMTIHASKGLEFQMVFIAGTEEEFIPHLRSVEDGGSIEEERRMFYVAVTRAEEHLFISYALTRQKFGLIEERQPSRFIEEIPEDIIQFGSEDPAQTTEDQRAEVGKKALEDFNKLIADK
jgi:ATP-dependent DNA helicase Rep/DNA helicase-2/ATP-dependent DNA helicase PcrA